MEERRKGKVRAEIFGKMKEYLRKMKTIKMIMFSIEERIFNVMMK